MSNCARCVAQWEMGAGRWGIGVTPGVRLLYDRHAVLCSGPPVWSISPDCDSVPPDTMRTNADAPARRAELYGLLGDLPDRHRPVAACYPGGRRTAHVHHRKTGAGPERPGTRAGLVHPSQGARPPRPRRPLQPRPRRRLRAGQGRTPARAAANCTSRPTPRRWPRQGCCGLCIDTWVFGERAGRTEMDVFKEMLWHGQVLWGMMVYDSLAASITWPRARSRCRAASARWACPWAAPWPGGLAALDERIKVCVDICCLTDFQALIEPATWTATASTTTCRGC